MNGEIGTILLNDKDIGGFLNWNLSIQLREISTKPMKEYQVDELKADAKPYWLKEQVTGTVDILFRKIIQGELVTVSKNRMKISIQDVPLNKLIYQVLEMTGV